MSCCGIPPRWMSRPAARWPWPWRQTPRKALDVRRIMCHGRRVNFSDLGLLPSLVRAVTDAGFTDPTPIQIEAIPPALAGRDIAGLHCFRCKTAIDNLRSFKCHNWGYAKPALLKVLRLMEANQ